MTTHISEAPSDSGQWGSSRMVLVGGNCAIRPGARFTSRRPGLKASDAKSSLGTM